MTRGASEEESVVQLKTPQKLDEPGTSTGVAISTPLDQQKRLLPTFEEISDISEGSESNGGVLQAVFDKSKRS